MPAGRRGYIPASGHKIEANIRGHPRKGDIGYDYYKEYMKNYVGWYRTVREDGYLAGREKEEYNLYHKGYMRKYRKTKKMSLDYWIKKGRKKE